MGGGVVLRAGLLAAGRMASLNRLKSRVWVGVDPSISNTGLVALDMLGNLILAIDGSDAYGKAYSSDIEKYLAQADYLKNALNDYEVARIGYENYSFDSVHRAFSLAEFGGVLKSRLVQWPLTLVAPRRVKKFATGNGGASKDMMREQASREHDALRCASEDICDAYFLALYALYKDRPNEMAKIDLGKKNLKIRLKLVLEEAN